MPKHEGAPRSRKTDGMRAPSEDGWVRKHAPARPCGFNQELRAVPVACINHLWGHTKKPSLSGLKNHKKYVATRNIEKIRGMSKGKKGANEGNSKSVSTF